MVHFLRKHPGLPLANNVEYKCRHCEKLLKKQDDYKKHWKTHIPRSHLFGVKCNLCKKSYGRLGAGKTHFQKSHPDLELDFEYKCQNCDQYFKNTEDYDSFRLTYPDAKCVVSLEKTKQEEIENQYSNSDSESSEDSDSEISI